MDFGVALKYLKQGKRLVRKGWNGKGIFIEIQRPDGHSKMTTPYIYIDTTGLQTHNNDAPKNRVPWLASQTDLLSDDWQVLRAKSLIGSITPQDLQRHYAELINTEELKPLTADQLNIVALMMEQEYRKGAEDCRRESNLEKNVPVSAPMMHKKYQDIRDE